jgi:hypothetical protein
LVRPPDTTAEAWQVHLATLRRLTGPERVALAFEMSAAARALSEAGLRWPLRPVATQRHPEGQRVWSTMTTPFTIWSRTWYEPPPYSFVQLAREVR